MPHIKYIKVNFILTREENGSITFSVKVQGFCFSVFLIIVLHCWIINNNIFQTEVFQNQINDLAVQLPLHLISTEYLNPLFAFEPKDLSMLYCTFFSFHQFENKLISGTLLPTSLKEKKVNLWPQPRWLLGSRATTWQNKTRTPDLPRSVQLLHA